MLRGVTVVARHGARGPNWAELGPFAEESDVVAQWGGKLGPASTAEEKAKADDNLSEAGRKQMRALGAMFRERFGVVGVVEWHSSTAKRCVASGMEFWKGFFLEKDPPKIQNGYDRDAAFKAWDAKDCAYKNFVDSMKRGDDVTFKAKALGVADFTERIWGKALGVREESVALRLYWCTYLCSLLECEAREPSKNALTSKLTADDAKEIRELARWIWERRFHRSGYQDFVGRALLELISSRSTTTTETPTPSEKFLFFRFMSCHDYSVMSALAAAGAETFEEVLGFGAYLLVEHYDDYDVWKLCRDPSSDGEEAPAEERVLEFHCEGFWKANLKVVKATEKHPFLRQLVDGSLAKKPFKEYVLQDSLYLVDFARALRLLADKAGNDAQATSLRGFADGADVAEKALHESFFKKWNIDDSNAEQKPYTLLYTAFMLQAVALDSFPAGLAALLPCFWVYGHVGALLLEERLTLKDAAVTIPPEYDEWIAMYGGEEFNHAVTRYRALVEHEARKATAEQRTIMANHFTRCTVLEFMFWRAPLDQVDWPDFERLSSTLTDGLSN